MIVVDDDVNAVNNMTKDFPWEECGFSVEASFEDGAEALRWLQTHTTDLVLCDIKMPRMSGIELARHLHAERREEKVIFISGFKDFEYARKAMEYGVLRYCVKPVTFRELRQTILHIREMLDGERGSRAPEEEDPARGHSITDVQIEKIQRYIQAHYAEVTLQTLADYMHMNTSYLFSSTNIPAISHTLAIMSSADECGDGSASEQRQPEHHGDRGSGRLHERDQLFSCLQETVRGSSGGIPPQF